MSMVKFSRTALDFGYDFVLLIIFLGHPIDCVMLIMYQVDSFDFPVEEARPEFSNSIEPSLTRPNRIWLIAGQSTEFYKKRKEEKTVLERSTRLNLDPGRRTDRQTDGRRDRGTEGRRDGRTDGEILVDGTHRR